MAWPVGLAVGCYCVAGVWFALVGHRQWATVVGNGDQTAGGVGILDCSLCRAFTPGPLELMVDTTVVPPSLSGTVATHILISEFDSGAKVVTEINECFVEVL